ncbi:tRNA synthetases class I-domain-containing protein [Astrocystis sublimbata]|nr:tRNA synthetases class I-domain-containing protein [Astrocystis sublimbata]
MATRADDGAGNRLEKSVKNAEKEREKERKKQEKQARFELKQAKKGTGDGGLGGAGGAGPATSTASAASTKATAKPKGNGPSLDTTELPRYIEATPPGEKKKLTSFDDPHFKAYNPDAVESAWYEWWEKEGFFKPQLAENGAVKQEGSFVVVLPPPNVTGNLHVGHALGNALQDIMVRWNRMLGKTTLWLPGCDHASISTQTVVENMLWRREGKTRHDLGRANFIETAWKWKEEYHRNINNAQRRMGGSFDWSREAFTMDANLTAAVQETFVRFHEEGLIYRANRLVNWCTKLNTALSNLEVVNKELSGRTLLDVPGYQRKVEFGVITHFLYPIDGADETIEVATTRPETMLGDTGIAVHPSDERYRHLVGKKARHPFIPGRLLPIVADDYVDKEFGTGAVKITPAHDANDFALGQRHNLEFINILTDDGLMNENAGPYCGQKRFDVRYAIQEDLKNAGLFVGKNDNPMTVPLCEKSKDVIEPLMKPQWWMRMRGLADAASAAVRNGEITFKPQAAEKSFFRWMDDINDWCISRQLWWGHQCPVYFAHIEGEADRSDNARWFSGHTEEVALAKATKAFPGKQITLERDPDVLDTWFSAGLWPFATLGWPKSTDDMDKFYPTSVLETGWDILFFWIARMVMLGIKLTGQVPFREVYCHSLVRDSDGRKMSKSLGNVIDPRDVITGISLEDLNVKLLMGNLAPSEVEKAKKYQKTAFPHGIPQCGTDALRFCLASYATGSGDINLDVKVLHGYRKFCNKIYQALKYMLGNLDAGFIPDKRPKPGKTLAERWILHKMTMSAKAINHALEEREFMKSTGIVYQYWYSNLCDVFIENSKALIRDGSEEERESVKQTLYTAVEFALLMSHPFMPFLTEELWQRLPRRPGDVTPSIVLASYPVYDSIMDDPDAEVAYELIQACSREIRSVVSQYKLDEVQISIQSLDTASLETLKNQVQSISSLTGQVILQNNILSPNEPRPSGCVASTVSNLATVYLFVKGRVDLNAEANKARSYLEKTQAAIEKQLKSMAVASYQEKVTQSVRDTDNARLAGLQTEATALQGTIKQFEQLQVE